MYIADKNATNRILRMHRGISTSTCKTIKMLSTIKNTTFKVNKVKTEQGISRGAVRLGKMKPC